MVGSPVKYDAERDAAGFHFDEKRAGIICGFIETFCQHVKGPLAGQKIVLEDWQRKVISDLFGWVDANGKRRYREAFIYIPRKQAKSTTCAALALAYFFTDTERGQEIYVGASELNQASLVWSMARQMIAQEPELANRCQVFDSTSRITRALDGSFFAPVSSKATTKHGMSPSFVILDELHAHRNDGLYSAMKTGMGARSAPLLISITTADYSRDSICNQILTYARNIRDGVIKNARFYPAIWETPTDADWTSPETWRAANPNYGISVQQDFYEAECLRAKATPSYENEFKRLYLNMQTEQDKRWLTMADWDACASAATDEELAGCRCYGGLDLASTRDLCALALYWPAKKAVRVWCWAPEACASKVEKANYERYQLWGKQGHITLTSGNVTDYRYIRQTVNELSKRWQLECVGYDPYNARHLAVELGTEDGIPMLEHRQGFLSMNEPAKLLERMVLSHELRHGGNPVLRWMASNASVQSDPAGNIKPVKPDSRGPDKVDGIIAACMAIGTATVYEQKEGPKRQGPSVYEERGILVLGGDDE